MYSKYYLIGNHKNVLKSKKVSPPLRETHIFKKKVINNLFNYVQVS